jgi:hypothetical protein
MTEESKGAARAVKAPDEAVKTEGIAAETTESTNEETIAKDTKGEAKTLGVKTDAAAEPVPTLRQIFSLPEKETDPSDDRWKAFQEALSKEVKGVKWISAMSDLAPKICELLDIRIDKVLVAAWKKVEALQKVLAESKKTPEKVVYLELAEHSIDYETRPFIDVKIKGASVKKLTLNVQLDCKLKGFVLKVQNGAIKEMETGNCEVKGAIKYGTLSIAEKKLAPVKLPLSIAIPSIEALSQPVIPAPESENESKQETPKSEDAPKAEPPSSVASETKSKPDAVERIEL